MLIGRKLQYANYDVNNAVEKFQAIFSEICNQHAPLKKKRVRNKKAPWLTDDVIRLMRERDILKKKAIKSGDKEDWSRFRTLKNKVNYEIKHSKKSFISESIQRSGNNTKNVWNTIRQVVPGKCKSTNITCLKNEDVSVTEPKDVANMLNSFFADIGPQLADKIPTINENSDRLKEDESKPGVKFGFHPVSSDYVLEKLSALPERKATGTDDLPAKLLKLGATSIVEPVTYLINLSLATGMFPNAWKNARICPVFKRGDTTNPSNYRPISILPVISKIIERAVFDQIYPFLSENNMIYKYQSGFRPQHSTLTALINITEDWYEAIDKGNYVGLVMIDLKKAFDTVNHDILLQKLKQFNVSNESIRWFQSYLRERSHNTVVNGIKSNSKNSVCGIPQGSILGPLLFIMYINDLPLCTSQINVSMYADDTALYAMSRDIDELIDIMNKELVKVRDWLIRNKLSLNVSKTEFMLMGTRPRLAAVKDREVDVNINGEKLKQVHSCKHLGVIVDESLTWHEQVCSIKKKVLPGLYMLRKCKGLLPAKTLSLLYKSIIAPHMDYCDTIWATCNVNDFDMIQKLQNRAAKIITGAKWLDSSSQALLDLNWDNIKERCKYHDSVTMYKIMHNHSAPYLRDRFNLRINERYELRGFQILDIPKPKINYKKRSFSYRGALSWNAMAKNLKVARNVKHFKYRYNQVNHDTK